jgi:glycosyltransferase involved in cell wall biosynthesis
MRVLLLAEVSAARVIGGAERVLREQALGLRRRGHQVSVVARAPLSDDRAQVSVDGIVEHRYQASRRSGPAFVLTSIARSLQAFDRAGLAMTPDAVVIHQSLAGLGPVLGRRRQVGAWVYLCLSLAHEEFLSRTQAGRTALERLRRAFNARLRRWCEGAVMRRCGRIAVLSEFMRRRVLITHDVPESRLHIIPGAADPTQFRPPDDPMEVRRQLQLPPHQVLLLTVRNLVPRMGLENLLHAIEKLGEEARDLLVLIGGEGPLRPALEQLIRDLRLTDRVRLLGFIPEDRLSRFYQAADLVLMPTHELEGFGLVTVEALACGTPVLGTPVGAIPEVLARLDSALLTDGTDGTALAAGIRRILRRFRDQPGEQERLSLKGRALVEQDYNWGRHSEQLETILKAACPNVSSNRGRG